ncbi:hypothetical protein SCA6_006720 [Theobroma cacao]
MNIIDSMLHQMLKEDPSFKPQGGRFGENDMGYDTDEKSMATLRRWLRIAREEYCRYRSYTGQIKYGFCSENMSIVLEALELEDTVKNYERRDATGWKFISSFRPERKGRLGASLDMLEFIWRCVLRKQLEKLLAIILGCMSAALLLAEATILPNGVDLSLFSILINIVGKQEMLVQVAAFFPLMYMCVCTYYSLFKIGMLMFYSFTPKQTSSLSLLMICSMVARYAPPISYNFLNLIHLPGNRKTIFEKVTGHLNDFYYASCPCSTVPFEEKFDVDQKGATLRRMGNIDDAVPFFGKGFNKIYPLIMVIYTLLLVTNFFNRVIDYFGNWKLFKFQDEVDDTDGFDPSGLIILQKERSWLERGLKVSEHVIPLARNFNSMSIDIEPGSNNTDKAATDTRAQSAIEIGKGDQLTPLKEEAQHDTSKEAISKKYSGIRAHQNTQASNENSTQKDSTSLTVDAGNSESAMTPPSGGLASKWESMKSGLLNFKSNLEAKKFLPLRRTRENTMSAGASSSESLDEIFQRLKRPTLDLRDYGAENDLLEHD